MKFFAKNKLTYLAALFLATSCLAFGGWGWGSHKNARSTDITFESTIKFNNGVTLPAGTYVVSVPNDQKTPAVTFSQDGKVVATEKANVVDEAKKNDTTEIDSTTQGTAQQVNAIGPSGWNEKLVFGNAGQ